MLKDDGLVPSLLAAVQGPSVVEPAAFWGQAVGADVLATLPDISPTRGTPVFAEADAIVRATQTGYLNSESGSAQAALDDAANQVEAVTGLPVAE